VNNYVASAEHTKKTENRLQAYAAFWVL